MFPFHFSTVVFRMSNQLPVVGVGFSYRRAVTKIIKTCTYTQRGQPHSLPTNESLLILTRPYFLRSHLKAYRETKHSVERKGGFC